MAVRSSPWKLNSEVEANDDDEDDENDEDDEDDGSAADDVVVAFAVLVVGFVAAAPMAVVDALNPGSRFSANTERHASAPRNTRIPNSESSGPMKRYTPSSSFSSLSEANSCTASTSSTMAPASCGCRARTNSRSTLRFACSNCTSCQAVRRPYLGASFTNSEMP